MGRWTKILVVGAVITFIASIAIGVGCFKWRGAIRAPRSFDKITGIVDISSCRRA
ncbi:hypothetical protein LMG28140_00886 [Paraburkholderia metrosideri]|uniref:Lipoprotein n=1 Tax=Paraburkholderia metrosideri TaxID=580937 RepID=A0ABN7HG49_9BURK|nr:hypothetical protein LMG28140_00886 [Paraburkholderia metrosideri]